MLLSAKLVSLVNRCCWWWWSSACAKFIYLLYVVFYVCPLLLSHVNWHLIKEQRLRACLFRIARSSRADVSFARSVRYLCKNESKKKKQRIKIHSPITKEAGNNDKYVAIGTHKEGNKKCLCQNRTKTIFLFFIPHWKIKTNIKKSK